MEIFLLIFMIFLYTSREIQGGNIETRIHQILEPSATVDVKFGISMQSDQTRKVLFVGGAGGVFSCPFSYNSVNNETVICTSATAVGDLAAKIGYEMASFSHGADDYLLICGNQHYFSCPDQQIIQRMTGQCHTYSISDKVQTVIPSPCPRRCPQGLVADLVFVVDASGSVGSTDFRKGLIWIITILEMFSYDIDQKNLHVGYVIFNGLPYRIAEPTQKSFHELRDEILSVPYNGGGTRTDKAIEASKDVLTNSRNKVSKIMITVTDGNSNEQELTESAALDARNEGIVMISVGVGSEVSTDELRIIATGDIDNSTRVMTVTNYDNLAQIIDELSQVIKETAATGLEGAESNSTTELTNCQFGSSITAGSQGFYIGAPGSYDRVGTVVEFGNINLFPRSTSSGHLNDTELASMLKTSRSSIKDMYLGYSVTSGTFRGDDKKWIITGAPRYLSRGLVLIYQIDDKNSYTVLRPSDLSGKWQLGSYYGHSVLAMDINADGYDDLIVSAPLYSKEAGYDEGLIFVYMNDRSTLFSQDWTSPGFSPLLLDGSGVSGSRFGMSVVNAGDIDQNGYDDVIIGAPFEKSSLSDDGSGAVYIYFASKDGLQPGIVQKILGKSIEAGGRYFIGFGMTIHGSVDFDNNGYHDIAVGAPSSEKVILLRSRKILEVSLTVTVFPTTINIINCARNLDAACSTVRACISARYKKDPMFGDLFDIAMNVTLDSLVADNVHKRFYFVESKSSVINVDNINVGSFWTCRQYTMQINPDNLGKVNGGGLEVTPQVRLQVDLSQIQQNQIMSGVLGSLDQTSKTADWSFVKGCSGLNGRCEHDLDLTATFSEKTSADPIILSGESKVMHVNCTIKNNGEDHAYFLKVNISSGYLTVHQVTGSCVSSSEEESDPYAGSAVIKYQSTVSVFKDMMLSGDSCDFTIYFDFSKLQSTASESELRIKVKVYSNAGGENTAFDSNPSNNEVSYSRALRYKSNVQLNKVSNPETVFFHPPDDQSITTLKTLEDEVLGGSGSNFHHKYSIYNNGPLGLANARVKLRWPEMTQEKYNLLYLVDVNCQPEDVCVCEKEGKANKYRISPNLDSLRPYFQEVTLEYPSASEALVSSKSVNCDNSICNEVICELSKVDVFKQISVTAYFKPWTPTFGKEFTKVDVYSSFNLIPATSTLQTSNTQETLATTMMSYDPSNPPPAPPSNAVNVGAIIGGIIGGIILLIFSVLVMWKAGFFQSKYGKLTREARRTIRESQRGNISDYVYDNPVASNPELNKSTEELY
uniref:integrin alpha-2-like isoform X1 n=2 Tax=Styela clava TaxID=7725 RepID=UPI00193A43D8|nr:integrin alpha-2-like isoform X1 [Styela clava]